MDPLSSRQKNILYHVINSYLATMQPVGSRALTSKQGLDFSAATIRNEMYDLEALGYLTHPHISSGRVPTDKGYRYYVDYLLRHEEIPKDIAHTIHSEFKKKIEHIEDLIEKTSQIVSTISHEACIAVIFRPHSFRFKQVNLVKLDESRVLVLWITTTGLVKNDIIEFNESIDEEYLKKITTFLNAELASMPLEEIEHYILNKLTEERASLYKMYQWTSVIVKKTLAKNYSAGSLFLEGRNYLLEKPEFQDLGATKRLFEILDNKRELFEILRSTDQQSQYTVLIGRENHSHDLWNCSLISAGFKLRDMSIGSITILGPKRLRYSAGISLLNYVTQCVNTTINRLEI